MQILFSHASNYGMPSESVCPVPRCVLLQPQLSEEALERASPGMRSRYICSASCCIKKLLPCRPTMPPNATFQEPWYSLYGVQSLFAHASNYGMPSESVRQVPRCVLLQPRLPEEALERASPGMRRRYICSASCCIKKLLPCRSTMPSDATF